MDREIVQVFWI